MLQHFKLLNLDDSSDDPNYPNLYCLHLLISLLNLKIIFLFNVCCKDQSIYYAKQLVYVSPPQFDLWVEQPMIVTLRSWSQMIVPFLSIHGSFLQEKKNQKAIIVKWFELQLHKEWCKGIVMGSRFNNFWKVSPKIWYQTI